MSKDPAILFYTSDFLRGTEYFSLLERGQYITLLCNQHQSGHIPLGHMTTICGSSESQVFKKFVVDENGLYFNERMEKEIIKRKSFCESRANNKSGVNQYTKKNGHTTSHMTGHMVGHMVNENENENRDIIKDVIEYLNSKIKSQYKYNNKKTQAFINARIKESYKQEDFKKVIDKKSAEWIGTEMEKFLRPETLFGTKFESYLNQQINKEDSNGKTKYKTDDHLSGIKEWVSKEGVC
jgi:uncharacterized phage protein (TIGR02220 family)